MPRPLKVIRSVEQLRALARGPALFRFLARVPETEFAIPEFSDESNQDATTRLSNYRNACGCFAGGLLMGFSVIAFFIAYALSGRGISDIALMDVVIFFTLFIVSTLIGKSLGVLWARIRAIQLMRRIAALAAAY